MPANGVSAGRLVDAPTVTNDDVLSRFLRALSPVKKVRAAAPAGDGTYANSYPDLLTLDEVDSQRPIAMFLTRRDWRRRVDEYTAVPFDLDASGAGAAAVRDQAAEIGRLLDEHGITYVPVSSGPTGGIHMWTTCPAGLPLQLVARLGVLMAQRFPAVDKSPLSKGSQGLLRPPGAAHRTGRGHARLIRHDVDEAVTILAEGSPATAFRALLRTLEAGATAATVPPQASPSTPRTASGRKIPDSILDRGERVRPVNTDEHDRPRLSVPWRPLGPRTVRYLQRRPADTPGAHQAAVHAGLRACALAGWHYDQVMVLVRDTQASPALEWLRTTSNTAEGGRMALSDEDAARRMERKWILAVEDAARLPRRPGDSTSDTGMDEPAAAAADLLARIEFADPGHWRRPSGPITRRVLRALAYLMTTSCSTEVSANVRRLAVLAACSTGAAANAIRRILDDGWFRVTADAVPGAGLARRLTPATSHTCTDDPHHMCAPHHIPAGHTAYPTGLDRSLNAPPPPQGAGALLGALTQKIAQDQAGVWSVLGRHAARTLEAVQAGVSREHLRQVTGYTRATVRKHLAALESRGLVRACQEPHETAIELTGRSLYDASAEIGTATRTAERAVGALIDQERHTWWRAEVDWCRLPYELKKGGGMRAEADQRVAPGIDPYSDRKYPRKPHPVTGRPGSGPADHARAWEIEAARIGAAALLVEADQAARRGQVVDPARLRARQAESAPRTQEAAA
jgi:DNA-binding transcriptional ArsR family regulator